MMKVFMRKPKRKPVFTASFHQIASFHTIEGRKTERGLGRFPHDFCVPTGSLCNSEILRRENFDGGIGGESQNENAPRDASGLFVWERNLGMVI